MGTAFRHYCGNMIILAMRINLVTPFAEKDAVKALGARWDPDHQLSTVLAPTDAR